MKKFEIRCLIVIPIIVFVFGCSSDDSSSSSTTSTDTYTRTQTPASTTVAVPASLSVSSSSSSRTAYAEDCDGCDSAMLYSQIKSAVQMMKTSVSSADLNLMVADIKMADGDVTTDQCYDQGAWSVVFTQEIYNALVKMEQEFGGEEGEANSASATFKNSIGQSINPPIAFKYSTTSEGGYAHQLSIADSCSAMNAGTNVETIRWDAAKTKLLSRFDDSMGTSTFEGSIAFDDSTDKSVVNMKYSDGSTSMKQTLNLAECTDAQKNGMTGDCAIFKITNSFTQSGEIFMISGGGKADDSGGYGKGYMSASMDLDGDGTDDNMTMQYEEAWDGTGALTYLAMCPEKAIYGGNVVTADCSLSGNWLVQGGTADSTYQEDSYSAQAYSVSGVSSLSDGSYHLVISSSNPNNNPETIVGYGEIRGNDSFWDFWGADSSGSFDVWTIGSSSLSDSGTDATVAAN